MSRLAKGEKVQIDRKSMRRLTIKNYEKLPEIIQKKEAEKKLADLMTQKAKQRAYQKELNERIRNNLKNKRKRDASEN